MVQSTQRAPAGFADESIGERGLRYAVVLVALVTLLAFAGLIPLGAWQDEYFTFAVQRQSGFLAAWHRMLQWSPRPLAESLIYLYGLAVEYWNRPLISVAVVPCWVLLAVALLGPTLWRGSNRLAALALLAMFWLGHPVGEAFYWPFAVIAYVPTAAAAVALLSMDWGGWLEHRAGAAGVVIALMVGAASSEVGAVFCVIYAPLAMGAIWRLRPRFASMLVVPLLLSVLVLCTELHGRVAQGAEVFGDPTIAHAPSRVWLSLVRALPRQILVGAGVPGSTSAQWLPAIASKCALFAGVYLCLDSKTLASTGPGQRLRLILIISTLFTATVTLGAALYNFGALCCERHDTLRQIYVCVALAALASLARAHRPAQPVSRRVGCVALLIAMLVPLIRTFPALRHDYREYAAILHASQESWRSGAAPGKEMQLFQAPRPQVVNAGYVAAGTYHINGFQGLPNAMLIYRGKQTLIVHPSAIQAGR